MRGALIQSLTSKCKAATFHSADRSSLFRWAIHPLLDSHNLQIVPMVALDQAAGSPLVTLSEAENCVTIGPRKFGEPVRREPTTFPPVCGWRLSKALLNPADTNIVVDGKLLTPGQY